MGSINISGVFFITPDNGKHDRCSRGTAAHCIPLLIDTFRIVVILALKDRFHVYFFFFLNKSYLLIIIAVVTQRLSYMYICNLWIVIRNNPRGWFSPCEPLSRHDCLPYRTLQQNIQLNAVNTKTHCRFCFIAVIPVSLNANYGV